MAESGKLERRRQDCLYYDLADGHQHLPYLSVKAEEAEWFIVIVGELLAEVASLAGPDHERLLEKITIFEVAHTKYRL